MTTVVYTPRAGQHFNQAAKEAISLSNEEGTNVEFEFNGIKVVVTAETSVEDAYKNYQEESDRLHEEYRKSPEGIAAAKESEKRAAAKKELDKMIDTKVANMKLELADPDMWREYVEKNQNDDYGAGILRYAERWAKLMQVEMAAGAPLKDIARQTSFDADNEGMSGFSQSCAEQAVIQCWKHGAELGAILRPNQTPKGPNPS